MIKFLKILGIIFVTIVVLLTSIYLYLTDFGRKGLLSKEPRKPKIEIPITYTFGWCSYQDYLTIDSLNVKVIESNLNLFNAKSLISYEICGHIEYRNSNWRPLIKEVHISEIIERDTIQNSAGRIIEITPIVSVKEHKDFDGQTQKFKFTNEMIINSLGWGFNPLRFKCGGKEQTIILHQKK